MTTTPAQRRSRLEIETERSSTTTDEGFPDEKLRALVDHLPVLIAYIDRAGKFRFSSRLHQQWWGRSEEEIIGHSHLEVTGRANHIFCEDPLAKALSGTPVTFEAPSNYPGAGEKYVEVSYVPDCDPSGEVSGVFVLVRDLTEKKAAEQKLINQKNEQDIIFNSVPALIFYKDLNNRLLRVNQTAAQIMGIPVGEIEGRATSEIYPDHADKYYADDLSVITSGKPKLGIIEPMRTTSGEDRWVRTDKIPYRDTDGSIKGVIVFAVDITDRIRAERERSELEQQLLQSQKMEALGTLAGGIAHDFNNMLSGILGYTGLASREISKDSKVSDYIKKINSSALRARDLVQQILTFTQKSNGVELHPVNLGDIVDEVLALVQPTLPSNIKISKKLSEENLTVLANSTQMHQVLLNLITNAGYAMRDSGGELRIRITAALGREFKGRDPVVVPDHEYVHISVSDTGTGMSEAIQKRIFEPYFTTKPVGEGSGLGLSVVHGIIASFKGVIRVTSQLGHGSTFDIYIPTSTTTQKEQIPVNESTPDIKQGEGRILFVDDEAVLAQLGHDVLSMLGYQVISCTNSLDALDEIRNAPGDWDLVITDQTMPEMSGVSLTQKIHEIAPNLPVILCTGYSASVGRSHANKSGAVGFLMKPYSVEQLATLTAKTILKKRARE